MDNIYCRLRVGKTSLSVDTKKLVAVLGLESSDWKKLFSKDPSFGIIKIEVYNVGEIDKIGSNYEVS